MYACDSLVSDAAGDSSGVEVVDDVVACGDDTLLDDAVHIGGWLSVLGDTLMCADGVARTDRRDAEVVVGPEVTKPAIFNYLGVYFIVRSGTGPWVRGRRFRLLRGPTVSRGVLRFGMICAPVDWVAHDGYVSSSVLLSA